MEPGDDARGVDEGVLEVGVAGEQLGLEEGRVGDVLEEGDVYYVRRGDVFEGCCFERHRGSLREGVVSFEGSESRWLRQRKVGGQGSLQKCWRGFFAGDAGRSGGLGK